MRWIFASVVDAVMSGAFDKSAFAMRALRPQVGNKKQWAPLIREGQVTLTAHAYVGVRGMPARGGQPDLSIEAFAEALNHMVNQSGGNWKTPDAKTLQAIQAEVARRQKPKASKPGG